MTRVRKHTCGAGALLGVLLLAAFAGTALTLHYEARGLARGEALDRAAGRIFAALVPGRPPGKPGARGGFRNNPRGRAHYCPDAGAIARARHGPAGTARCAGPERHVLLRRHRRRYAARRSHGLRRPRTGPGWRRAAHGVAMREGALGAGLAGLESVGSGALMAPHLPAIEAALGRSLGSDALYVTGDHGLRYLEQALYRRAQPGRAYLNRLETGLDMSSADPANPAGRNIVAAGAVTARAAGLSGAARNRRQCRGG